MLGGEHIYVDKMINPVEAKCGALSCPSYSDEYVFISCSEYHIDLSPGFLHFYLVEYCIGIAAWHIFLCILWYIDIYLFVWSEAYICWYWFMSLFLGCLLFKNHYLIILFPFHFGNVKKYNYGFWYLIILQRMVMFIICKTRNSIQTGFFTRCLKTFKCSYG